MSAAATGQQRRSRANRAGRAAASEGVRRDQNPYLGVATHSAWDRGWVAAAHAAHCELQQGGECSGLWGCPQDAA